MMSEKKFVEDGEYYWLILPKYLCNEPSIINHCYTSNYAKTLDLQKKRKSLTPLPFHDFWVFSVRSTTSVRVAA